MVSPEPLFPVTDTDREFFRARLQDFLPPRLIDIHTHVWQRRLMGPPSRQPSRVVKWPSMVAKENPVEHLLETYRLLFPAREVLPLIFANLREDGEVDGLNRYVRDGAGRYRLPSLIFARPEWSGALLERRIRAGGFLGAKVYLAYAPAYIPEREIRIFDFLPPHQLRVLDRHRRIVMLHVPRPQRLRDPVNLAQMLQIERDYPNLHLIIAHVGRAYCREDVGNAFEVLAESRRMFFDISANTNDWVFEQLIRAVGPRRILFGSDLPILRMRSRRIEENGTYINLVPRGLYGDVSADAHMREVDGADAERLTFFLYEEIDAFRRAAARTGLTCADVDDVFFNNADRLLRAAGHVA